jgi:hypothetical protein
MEISSILGWDFVCGYAENTKIAGSLSTQNWGFRGSCVRGMNRNMEVSDSAWKNDGRTGKGGIGGNEATGGVGESGSHYVFVILYA